MAQTEPNDKATAAEIAAATKIIRALGELKAQHCHAEAESIREIVAYAQDDDLLVKTDGMSASEKLEAIRSVMYEGYNTARSLAMVMLVADAGAADRVVDFFEARALRHELLAKKSPAAG